MYSKWRTLLSLTLVVVLLTGCSTIVNNLTQVAAVKQQPKKLTIEEVLSKAEQHLNQNGARYQVSTYFNMHLKGPKALHEEKGEFAGTLKFQGNTDMSNNPRAFYSEGTLYTKSIEGFKEEKDELPTKLYHDGQRVYGSDDGDDWQSMDASNNPIQGVFPHPAFPLHKLDDLSGQLAAWKKSKTIQMTETDQAYVIELKLDENADITAQDTYLSDLKPYIDKMKEEIGEDAKEHRFKSLTQTITIDKNTFAPKEMTYELQAVLPVEADNGVRAKVNFVHRFEATWKGKHPGKIQVPEDVKNNAKEVSNIW